MCTHTLCVSGDVCFYCTAWQQEKPICVCTIFSTNLIKLNVNRCFTAICGGNMSFAQRLDEDEVIS